MGGVGRGIDFLREQREKRGYGGTAREYMKGFWLVDDQDRARMFFGTEGDQCVVRGYHTRQIQGRNGKRDWTKELVCPRTRAFELGGEADESIPCTDCDGGDQAWLKPAFYVYVVHIDHNQPAPGRQQGKRGNLIVYREPINEVRLWLVKTKDQPRISDKFGEFGTLLDVSYDFTRFGAKGQQGTSYSLERNAAEPRPQAVTDAFLAVPDLAEVVARDFADRAPQAKVQTAVSSFDEPGRDYQAPDDSGGDLISFDN